MTDKFIPYSTQDIDETDIEAVVAVLKDPFITQGPTVDRFEESVQRYCDVPHAVAVSSATAGLHVALAALGVGPGSRVWAPPITFVGTTNAALMLGADVDFVDIDASTINISTAALEEKLASAKTANKLPDVLMVVHFSGRSCDMAAIHALCEPLGISIIEDAAHAMGAQHVDGRTVGCCHHSDACVFSFHPVKPITTAEGGMITTRNADLAEKMRMLRSHGTTRNPDHYVNPDPGAWYYEQTMLGYNYRLTDIQAALGANQMNRLDEFMTRRRNLAARYPQLLSGLPLQLPPPSDLSAWHLYVVQLTDNALRSRREVFDHLRAAGIGVNVHYIPVHLQPYYARLGFKPGDCRAAEAYYENALSIPLYPRLSNDMQDQVVEILKSALS